MKAKSVYKIPKGKLLKISLDYDEKNNIINMIGITGDFFAYPEEIIEILEDELKNSIIDKELLLKKINTVIEENNIQFIGLNAEGLVDGILKCLI